MEFGEFMQVCDDLGVSWAWEPLPGAAAGVQFDDGEWAISRLFTGQEIGAMSPDVLRSVLTEMKERL